ncbi:MAG TPA: glycoside hydrolase family 127 protein, partial [Candidatus Synoicihabitans sp.]|nr:glycoside hydrolase family 127 protein [Candidatus Synoicihabitans sp.]
GLPPKAEPYPNWESTGLDGHSAGHYLTALAQAVATSSHPELSQRLHYMVAELARVQAAHGDGYVGGVPGSRKAWEAVARGQLEISNFSVNGLWVPWYNLHKTFAGLRDTWVLTANAQARDVFVGLSDWCVRLTAQLSDTQMQDMLRAEHGGMNEVLADAFAITGDRRYLEAAARFSHRAVLDPLLRKEDRLTGLHANTQIPKVIGFARIAELGGDASGWDAARFFWETVVQRRSVAFGGNSVREHFNAPDDFHSMLESREGPETCNTYNMLRLSEQLFRHEPAARYVDYYERAHFNHLLSSQHPEHGGLVYFTPIRPQHYRVYSQPNVCFWCCVGSGMETHGKHGRFVYAHDAESLYVNLFVASTLRWPERGLTLRQETAFPEAPRTVLHLDVEQPQRLTLRVRHPSWVRENEFAVTVNGEPWPMRSSPSSFVALTRDWRKGDRIEVSLPMHTTVEPLPDGSDYVALLHGPLVLAAKTSTENLDGLIADDARMGHIAPGRYEPLARSPMLVGDREKLADAVRPVQGQPLTFTAADLLQPPESRDLELIPFYRVHDARYMIYWRTTTPAGYAEVVRTVA